MEFDSTYALLSVARLHTGLKAKELTFVNDCFQYPYGLITIASATQIADFMDRHYLIYAQLYNVCAALLYL